MDKTKPKKVPMVSSKNMTEPQETVVFAIVGSFPLSKSGYRYILTCLDQATKWLEAVPVTIFSARTIAKERMSLFASTGIPREILTDQGSQFIGSLVSSYVKG